MDTLVGICYTETSMENLTNKYILGNAFDHFYKIPNKSTDLIFTSIPDFQEILEVDKDFTIDRYHNFFKGFIKEFARIIKNSGFIVMSQTDRKTKGCIFPKHIEICNGFLKEGFKIKDYKILVKDRIDKISLFRLNYSHIITFTKEGKVSREKRQGNYLRDIWIFKMPKNLNFFPEEFVKLIIDTYSKENDFIFDPFAGRGTVLKIAKQMNRKYLGYEINKDVFDPDYIQHQQKSF